ncbi:MAG: type II toxin-antitoxin system Phd/YefM family antitoxin [Magnetococcus sp. DMHC-1]
MSVTTLSSRMFNQDVSKAKKVAEAGPVFITNRGRSTHVLLTFDEYKRITGGKKNIADLLAMPSIADVELEIPRFGDLAQPADFS